MNLIAPVLLLHLFIVSCVYAGKVLVMDSNITFDDMEAYFSPSEEATVEPGVLNLADPLDACENLRNKPKQSSNPFVLIARGGCSFEHKVRNAQSVGFKAAIIHDNVDWNILFEMDGDEEGIKIQAVFVTKATGETLKKYASLAETRVMLVPSLEDWEWPSWLTVALIVSLGMLAGLVTCDFICRQCTSSSNATSQFNGMSSSMVKAMPSVTFTSVRGYSAICLEDYSVGDKLRVLPCGHKFHAVCVDSWLTSWRTFCPVCKRDTRTSTDELSASESTPLLRSSVVGSSLVNIDPPPLGSSLSFSPSHMSSSYSQHSFRSSSHHSWISPTNSSRISADFGQQASPFRSSSERSYITCEGSIHSIDMLPYHTSPSNASPGHRFNSLLYRESEGSLSPFASAHSLLGEC